MYDDGPGVSNDTWIAVSLVAWFAAVVAVTARLMPENFTTADAPTDPAAPVKVDPKASMAAMKVSGKKPPKIVTFKGKTAYAVTFKGGKIHGGGTDCNVDLIPPGVFPCTECRVDFQVWLADNFPWVKLPGKSVGGKLGGFEIGHGVSSGARYSTTGASYRLTYHENGGLSGYLYPQLRGAFVGKKPSWGQLDQSEELKRVSVVQSGVHVWDGNKDLKFARGRWNAVSMYLKLNTPGRKDGVMELAVNGVTKRLDGVRYRNDDAKINGFKLAPFAGGATVKFAPPSDTKVYFADYVFRAGE